MKIKVIGVGGIASCLLPILARYLNFCNTNSRVEITLIDGDSYEEKNQTRQVFEQLGNKAIVTAEKLMKDFPTIYFRSNPNFVTEYNVIELVRNGDIIFSLCGQSRHQKAPFRPLRGTSRLHLDFWR